MATTEELILTKYFGKLVDAIVAPGPVANDLFSVGMIARDTRDEATNEHVAKNTRASNLVSAVLAAVRVSPNLFSSFLNVMKKHPPGNLVAEMIAREYRGEPAEEHVEPSFEQLTRRDIRSRHPPSGGDREGNRSEEASAGREGGQHKGRLNQEASVMCGILQCVIAIGGMTLLMWLGFMFVYTKLEAGPGSNVAWRKAGMGAGGCRLPEVTRSNKVYQELKGKVDPKELARCLEFEPQDIEDLRDATKSNKDLLSGVLDMWFKGSEPPVCWETIVEAVKCVGNKRLASEIERQHSA